jgi:tRNA(Ile)-lysidine synthase
MPPRDLIDRFRRDLQALTGAAPERLAVAVSGGPDSLALLLLAHAAAPGQVVAATVDHRLRPENAEEARLAARVCASLGVPHAILSADAPPAGASVQALARALRYRLLAGWAQGCGALFLATAHHVDDQAETVLMRLARGAGVAGLSGVRPARPEGEVTLVRPLLGWRRSELAPIVEGAGVVPVDDPSNRSGAYDRTAFRVLLDGNGILSSPRIAAAASHLREAEEALAWAADREWQARAEVDVSGISLNVAGLPPELLRRLVARAVETLTDSDWRRDKLATALDALRRGEASTIAGLRILPGALWRFEHAPPRRTVRQAL